MKSLALLIPLLIAPAAFADEGFGKLSPQEVQARLKQKNVYVFDNNSRDAFQSEHVPGAKWVEPSSYDAKDLPADKSATLIFYCHDEH